jgi:cation diffusion facilitator CzcD-associated flavoprotein CzcO
MTMRAESQRKLAGWLATAHERRWRLGAATTSPASQPAVAIIGAGLGGIATAANLARAGFLNFIVYEKAAGPGGVWWHNTYPGCEVDVNSQAYSYSFFPYIWNRTHATQEELQSYIEAVINRYEIAARIRFNVNVSESRWNERESAHYLLTSRGREGPFDLVVSCVGMLSTPNIPTWAKSAEFQGPVFHTSEYEHDVNIEQKIVALIGTGSTACQIAPTIAPTVKQLDIYQREPGYVLPKRSRPFTPDEILRFQRYPFTQRIDRWRLLWQAARDTKAFNPASRKQKRVRDFHRSYLERTVTDPVVRQALLPEYPYGCKRPVFGSSYYRTFNRANVRLIPKEVRGLSQDSVIDVDGQARRADVVIVATGFQASVYLAGIKVYGDGAQELHEFWAGEPWAFLGMTVPGFPNFLILYGPNTNGGWSICAQLERQSEIAVRYVRRLSRGHGPIDTRPYVARTYDRWIRRANHQRRGSSEVGCHNYYRAPSGKNVTQWPYSHLTYALSARFLPRVGLAVYGRRKRPGSTARSSE